MKVRGSVVAFLLVTALFGAVESAQATRVSTYFTFTASRSTVSYARPVRLTATLKRSGGRPIPYKWVTFYRNGVKWKRVQCNSAGSVTVRDKRFGTTRYFVRFAGDSSFQSCTSGTRTVWTRKLLDTGTTDVFSRSVTLPYAGVYQVRAYGIDMDVDAITPDLQWYSWGHLSPTAPSWQYRVFRSAAGKATVSGMSWYLGDDYPQTIRAIVW